MKQLLLPAFLFLFQALPAQTIRYVDHNATGAADGSSWANAFTRFQQALAVAKDGDEIWIARGIYKPTASNDRFAFYNLPSGIQVYGGFTGAETQRDQRDWALNPTILSGDIGVPGDSTDNSFNILYSYSPNEKTRLDGLFFEEGNATNSDNSVDSHRPSRSGGGIYLDGEGFGYAQLSVSNCTFRHNRAQYQGGGIYANGRDGGMAIMRLENCVFEKNISKTFGAGCSIENYYEQPFALEIKGCEFRGNNSLNGGEAIWLRVHQNVSFIDCKFLNNRSKWGETVSFGQVDIHYPVIFKNCLFKENGENTIWYICTDDLNDAQIDFESCVFENNGLPVIQIYLCGTSKCQLEIKNCIFDKNSQLSNNFSTVVQVTANGNGSKAYFTNCLFFENQQGEIDATAAVVSYVKNSIFIDLQEPFPGDIFMGSGKYFVANSLFRLPSCEDINGFSTTLICDSSNHFALDPLFVNANESNFHLQPCSPAINAGNNAILDSLNLSTDLDGNTRIRNGIVDIGPYERHISLNTSVLAQPGCAGASDGAVELSADLCPPFSFSWSNGVTTGSNTTGLAAGTYVFSASGTNNIQVMDTLVMNEPQPLEVFAEGHDVSCAGAANGWVEASAIGGTKPYAYTWDGILSPFNLPPGIYTVHTTDANACTGTAQAAIGSPDPIQVFYTLENASCIACADGSIVFDSITGGVNPTLPAPAFNLPIGHYCITITDAVNCAALVCFDILGSSSAQEATMESLLKLTPNPTASGESGLLEWLGNETAMVRVLDLQGKVLEQKSIAPNSATKFTANWPSGFYLMEIRTETGKNSQRIWSIF